MNKQKSKNITVGQFQPHILQRVHIMVSLSTAVFTGALLYAKHASAGI
jgi:hypothetical protein